MRTLLLNLALSLLAPISIAQAPKPEDLKPRDGAATIPDRATYEKLSHQGDAGRDAYLNGIEFVKFILLGAGSKKPTLYWMNTNNHHAHPFFMREFGIGGGFGRGRGGRGRRGGDGDNNQIPAEGITMRGAVSYRPLVKAPDGTPGAYVFDFQPNDSHSFELLKFCYDILIEKAPFLKGKLAYHPLYGGLARYNREKMDFEKARLPVYLDDFLDKNIAFLPMNPGQTFGRLRRMSLQEIPTPRDVVLYESLPNELPRVAGMITGVRQTPLSHVNLRAIQDRVPNAYVAGAAKNPEISKLVGKYVQYTVRRDGFTIREATQNEVEAHFKTLRPMRTQTPPLDLSVTTIKPLSKLDFGSSKAFGVKTANVAELGILGLPKGTVPDGFGVPFHFYVAFMKHNGLDKKIEQMITDPELQKDAKRQKKELSKLRKKIEKGDVPDFMREALAKVQISFGATPIRCRSSSNNEDLPGFSGAGLYESSTRMQKEHLAATVRRVYASLWSDRAFEERQFYRVDQTKTAMGVLIHESHKLERANGVAVTLDVLYQREGYNYVNAQIGEDMVTNPQAHSIPEEILLPWQRGTPRVMQSSNRVADDKRVLGSAHLQELKLALGVIHNEFARLYGKRRSDPKFAMEIEFKITKDGKLVIKQARPWLFQ